MFLLECQFMRGEGSKLLREGGKVRGRMGNAERAQRAFPEFRFCVLNADVAELTRRLMEGGGGGAILF